MDFPHLDYFRMVAKLGNMSQAAKKLYISQPGLSRYITRLEEEIGVPLFERRKGRIVLNTYGQLFLANVNLAFDQLEQGVEAVRQLYFKDQNVLSVSCSIEDFLIDHLKEFSPRHPEIGIRQYTYPFSELETQLVRQNLDLAVCAHPIHSDIIRYERLSQCPYVLICHRDNPLAPLGELYLKQAQEQSFVCENSRLSKGQLTTLCRAAGFLPKVSHEIENGYILFNLLESNHGVALIPLAHFLKINSHFPDHHLCVLLLKDDCLPMSEIGAAYLPEHGQTGSTAIFLDYLRTRARQELAEIDRFFTEQ